MYILLCGDDSYSTRSTKDLELRLSQHQCVEGAIIPKRDYRKIVYYEEFQRIDEAYYREKQVQKGVEKERNSH